MAAKLSVFVDEVIASFLRYTGYINLKRFYKSRFIADSSSFTTTELSILLTSCLIAIKTFYLIL